MSGHPGNMPDRGASPPHGPIDANQFEIIWDILKNIYGNRDSFSEHSGAASSVLNVLERTRDLLLWSLLWSKEFLRPKGVALCCAQHDFVVPVPSG